MVEMVESVEVVHHQDAQSTPAPVVLEPIIPAIEIIPVIEIVPDEQQQDIQQNHNVGEGENTQQQPEPTDAQSEITEDNKEEIKKRGILKYERTYSNKHVDFEAKIEFIPYDEEKDKTIDIQIVKELRKVVSYRALYLQQKEEEEQKKKEEDEEQKKKEDKKKKKGRRKKKKVSIEGLKDEVRGQDKAEESEGSSGSEDEEEKTDGSSCKDEIIPHLENGKSNNEGIVNKTKLPAQEEEGCPILENGTCQIVTEKSEFLEIKTGIGGQQKMDENIGKNVEHNGTDIAVDTCEHLDQNKNQESRTVELKNINNRLTDNIEPAQNNIK